MDDKNYGMGSEPEDLDIKEGVMKCASCVGRWARAKADKEGGVLYNGQEVVIPRINDAVTCVPTWETTTVQGQGIMALVALPTCLSCIQIKKESPVERATRSGLALPGPGGVN